MMITWLLYVLWTPTSNVEIFTWAWCGVMLDLFLFGQLYQLVERLFTKHK